MKKKSWISLFFLVFLLSIPSVFALEFNLGVIGSGFEAVWGIFQNNYVMFGFVFILLFALFYAIVAGALGFVPLFKGEGGQGVNRMGGVASFALAGLTVLAIVYFSRGNLVGFLERILGGFGFIGAIILAIIVFAAIYYGFKKEGSRWNLVLGLAAAGLALFVAGQITDNPSWSAWGVFLAFIVGIIALMMALRGGADSGDASETSTGSHRPSQPGQPTTEEPEQPEQSEEAEVPEEPEDWYTQKFIQRGFPLRERLVRMCRREHREDFYNSLYELYQYEDQNKFNRELIYNNNNAITLIAPHGGYIEPNSDLIAKEIYKAATEGAHGVAPLGGRRNYAVNFYAFRGLIRHSSGEVFPENVRFPDGSGVVVDDPSIPSIRGSWRLHIKCDNFHENAYGAVSRVPVHGITVDELISRSLITVAVHTQSKYPDDLIVGGKNAYMKSRLLYWFREKGVRRYHDADHYHPSPSFKANTVEHIVNRHNDGISIYIGSNALSTRDHLKKFITSVVKAFADHYFHTHTTIPENRRVF